MIKKIAKKCLEVLGPYGFAQTYSGNDGTGDVLLGFTRNRTPLIYDEVQVQYFDHAVFAEKRLTILPCGQQWDGSFVSVSNNPLSASFDFEDRRQRELFWDELSTNALTFGSECNASAHELGKTASAVRGTISVSSPSAIEICQADPSMLCAELEASLNAEKLETSRLMRRSSMLNSPKNSQADEDLEFLAFKIASHSLVNGSTFKLAAQNENILCIAVQLLASHVYDAPFWAEVHEVG